MKRRPVTNLRITIDKNVQGCQFHWGDQELVAGVYHKSFSYSRARGDDLTTFSSVDDSPLCDSSLCDSPFDGSPIDNCPIEDSPLDDCSAIVHQCDQIFLPLDDSSLCSRLPWRSRASTRAPRTGTPWSTLCPTRQMLSLRSDSQVLYSPPPLSCQFPRTHLLLKEGWGEEPLERATFWVRRRTCLILIHLPNKHPDLIFVKKSTRLEFWAKNFSH